MTPIVLYVHHKGQPKMVGKVLPQGVFFHAAKPEQYHRNYSCSFPLDAVVLDYLDKEGVGVICCMHHGAKKMFVTDVQSVRNAPKQRWGGRLRHYLSDDLWDEVAPSLTIPWINQGLIL